MIRSSFAGFTTGLFGLSTAQKGLDITGHNITNINTAGYCRQRLDQVSLYYTGANDKYASTLDTRVGYGAMVTGISQMRDPFLDLRFRSQIPIAGESDEVLTALNQLNGLLDEVDKAGAIGTQITALVKSLQDYTGQVGDAEHQNMVRTTASILTNYLNRYSDGVTDSRTDLENSIGTTDVNAVNKILEDIKNLNKNIEDSEAFGGNSLELQDQRNLLIDELAKYANIRVKEVPTEVSAGKTINRLHIDLVCTNGDNIPLINGPDEPAQFNVTIDPGKSASLDVRHSYDTSAVKSVNSLLEQIRKANADIANTSTSDTAALAALQQNRTNLITKLQTYIPVTDAGSDITLLDHGTTIKLVDGSTTAAKFSYSTGAKTELQVTDGTNPAHTITDMANSAGFPNTATKNLANKTTNILSSGSFKGQLDMLNESGEFDGPNAARGFGYYTKMLDNLAMVLADTLNKANTDDENGNPWDNGGPLFVASDGNTPITAKTIAINPDWTNGTVQLVAGEKDAASGQNTNILRMITLLQGKHEFTYKGTNKFSGTFNEYYDNLQNMLGLDIKTVTATLQNSVSVINDIDNSRDSISAVSLDEEGMNLLKYQKCYNAAARFMTTLDEALDTIINNMGVVGR